LHKISIKKYTLVIHGGAGGLIAVDKNHKIAMPFYTEDMYRGYIKFTGEKLIKIYKE
jgi:beta-aspartyl-peptidase (threonine type)